MHSVFFDKENFRDTGSWEWLRPGDLKKATEGIIMAAQEQAIRTRMIRHHSRVQKSPKPSGHSSCLSKPSSNF